MAANAKEQHTCKHTHLIRRYISPLALAYFYLICQGDNVLKKKKSETLHMVNVQQQDKASHTDTTPVVT